MAKKTAKKRPAGQTPRKAAKKPEELVPKIKRKEPVRPKLKKKLQRLPPERLQSVVSGMQRMLTAQLQKEFGADLGIGVLDASMAAEVGLSFPSFCLEFLFDCNVLRLGKFILYQGLPGIGKSGLAFETARWFIEAEGGASYFENESKWSREWAASTIGWDKVGRFVAAECRSINEWQRFLIRSNRSMQAQMMGTEGKPGPGKVVPYLQIVDSLMGKSTEESQAKIEEEGSAGRGYSIEAQSVSKFLRKYPQDIIRWPFLLVGVNHLKPGQDDRGMPNDKKPGGYAPDFHESAEVKIYRRSKIVRTNYSGNQLVLVNEKNSYGQGSRQVTVDVIWWKEEYENDFGEQVWRQRTVWNWHGATVKLLLMLKDGKKGKGSGALGTAIRDITGLVADAEGWSHSKLLGFPKKAPNDKVGAALCRNQAMVRELRRLFGIKMRKPFEVGVDYDEQVREAKISLARIEELERGKD